MEATGQHRAARPATRQGQDVVAVILAVGICTALNFFTFAVVYDAVVGENPGISENATQVLTGWGGGIIGVIGAVVGYTAGLAGERRAAAREEDRVAQQQESAAN